MKEQVKSRSEENRGEERNAYPKISEYEMIVSIVKYNKGVLGMHKNSLKVQSSALCSVNAGKEKQASGYFLFLRSQSAIDKRTWV